MSADQGTELEDYAPSSAADGGGGGGGGGPGPLKKNQKLPYSVNR